MPDPGLLEQNKQKQPDEIFKTQQIQDSVQLQQNHMQQDVFAQTQTQAQKTEQSTARKKRGIFNKEKKEEPYTKERKNDFLEQLRTSSKEHLRGKHSNEFKDVIKKIQEYIKIASRKKENADAGEKLMEVKSMIQNYISAKSSDPNAAEDEELKIIKLYEMWFDSFTNGSLQIPSNVDVESSVKSDLFRGNSGLFEERRKIDMSDQPLFVGEPNITEVLKEDLFDIFRNQLLHILMVDPMAIKRAMRDNGKTVTIRKYKPVMEGKKKVGLRPEYVTVSKIVEVKVNEKQEETLYARGLWVKMLQKVWSAGQDDLMETLAGELQEVDLRARGIKDFEKERYFNYMRQAWEQGGLICQTVTKPRHKDILKSDHLYEITEVYEKGGKKFVKLKDPQASTAVFKYVRTVGPDRKETFQRERLENGVENGILEMTYEDFLSGDMAHIRARKTGNILDAK